ncbi:MAG: hypothetical protein E6G13_12150 [Actinobacteria bacterium]|nr:MAG: hypothetical protein E6G13_12150 [Actinomycetota bacterium]
MELRRIIAPFFALAGIALVPWTVWLTFSLPAHHETANWRTTWAGFDIALAVSLGVTALASLRRSPWLEAAAAISGTLLLTDAWFDITLEAGGKHLTSSLLEAAFVELPLAAICFWVARDGERALARALPTSPAGPIVPVPTSPRRRIPDPHRQAARSQDG